MIKSELIYIVLHLLENSHNADAAPDQNDYDVLEIQLKIGAVPSGIMRTTDFMRILFSFGYMAL